MVKRYEGPPKPRPDLEFLAHAEEDVPPAPWGVWEGHATVFVGEASKNESGHLVGADLLFDIDSDSGYFESDEWVDRMAHKHDPDREMGSRTFEDFLCDEAEEEAHRAAHFITEIRNESRDLLRMTRFLELIEGEARKVVEDAVEKHGEKGIDDPMLSLWLAIRTMDQEFERR